MRLADLERHLWQHRCEAERQGWQHSKAAGLFCVSFLGVLG